MLCPSCPSATEGNQKSHPPGSFSSHTLCVMTGGDQNPSQQALPASIGFLLETFPSCKMRRHQQSWHRQLQQRWCKSEAESHMQNKGYQSAVGYSSKISKNSCGKDSACHNLWAVVLRPEVHMPTSGPERQSCLGISPLNQKISFSVGRKPPFCHSTLLK